MADAATLTLNLGNEAEKVIRTLDEALRKLQDSGWGPDLDIRRIGDNEFAYRFHEQYEVTFTVGSPKPAEGPTEEMWLEMLTIRPSPGTKSG